jgi:hypothetical protein
MTNDPTFYDRFRANMELLGLAAPRSVFGTLALATANIAALSRAMQQYPQRVTVVEIWRTIPAFATAAAMSEVAVVLGGIGAAFYVGACLGSLLVATGQSLSPQTIARLMNGGVPQPVWRQLPHIDARLRYAGRGQR